MVGRPSIHTDVHDGDIRTRRVEIQLRIDQAIREAGWTNIHAARALGVTERAVLNWRRGEATPMLTNAHRLAAVFGGKWTDYHIVPPLESAA